MVEGGLYEKLPGFKQKIDEVLREYIISVSDMLPGNIKYEFTTGENTTLFGTALAGLWE